MQDHKDQINSCMIHQQLCEFIELSFQQECFNAPVDLPLQAGEYSPAVIGFDPTAVVTHVLQKQTTHTNLSTPDG